MSDDTVDRISREGIPTAGHISTLRVWGKGSPPSIAFHILSQT